LLSSLAAGHSNGLGETVLEYIETGADSSQTTPQEALLKSAKFGKRGMAFDLK
jgi:hypothetical protein